MKPAILYGIGALLISAGVVFISASGRAEGIAEANRHVWEKADADHSEMGTVADADIESHRDGSPDSAA